MTDLHPTDLPQTDAPSTDGTEGPESEGLAAEESEALEPKVWEYALGFMNAQILFTADELGVFEHLSSPPSEEEAASLSSVAEATGLSEDAAERLLTALCGLDLVDKTDDGRYVNTTATEQKLVPGRPGYIGSMFQHLREDLYPAWRNLTDILRAGGGSKDRRAEAPSEDVYSDLESVRNFMEGMFSISYDAAKQFAETAPELEEVDRVVDLGGASGAFLIALAETHPKMEGTVVDLDPVRPVAEEHFERYGVEDRLSFEEGDFFEDPVPEEADAYVLGFILHDWSQEDGSVLLEKIAEASAPGDLLIIGESLLNENKTGPLHVARSDLNMMVAARGRERTAREYFDWIVPFGFVPERVHLTTHGKHYLIARWSPEEQENK